ncbi:amino acid adenylation domain-containing protein [Gloeocapsopsis crepidinum LEGE 06123]|uniref:Amino acid adenylation domain-containing protein n=2 Tax=Gloeocapsopsis crepidinum LEGE 06123 TaxID=588587 RepID=A0ABR9UPS5_9CHRO|nr:non-ribosomal peptide synthetase [Gloeocapsopsis crepidinum]MBE9190290.1 amino acid adenylation domain-containing protein [Gloeocapsopsis crepidinum LEGE 06123]
MQSNTIQGFRLSPQQKRLWSLQANSSVYKTQCAVIIEGNLNVDLLKKSIEKITDKHEMLRTRFHCLSGMKMPIMVVENYSFPIWQELNWTDCSPQEQLTKFDLLFDELIYQDINWIGNYFNVYLVQFTTKKYILIISLPAIYADTWTLANVVQEISNLYQIYLKNHHNNQEEVVQYVQFAEWQNQLLEESDAEAGKNYWSQVSSLPLNTLLPFEAKKYQYTFSPASLRLRLAPNITNKYATTEIFLLTCWQILLWRLTKQADITIGMVARGREYEELHDALGLFAKTLPIRCQLTADLSFTDVLHLVEKQVADAEEWQDYFVDECLGEDSNRIAFPFGFEFSQSPILSSSAAVNFAIYRQYTCIEPFKIKLSCIESNNLFIDFSYNQELFTLESIQQIAAQFQTLVTSAAQNPETPISKLEILSPSDRQKLLVDFNNTQRDFPLNRCIHQIFEEQAANHPDKIAVVFEDEQLTYAELNHKANQLAHYLRSLKIDSEQIVGIYLERSLETIVAILGILKAGYAYLVFDVNLPAEAIAMRSHIAEVALVLTQESLAAKLPNNLTYQCLDKNILQQSQENLSIQVSSDNLVYVVFTSGSTGTPKGVAIEHRQLLNYVWGILERLSLPAGASFATVSTFAADLGNTAVFSALCSGGCLHIVAQHRTTDSKLLADYFQRHSVDCLKIVPSHLAALLEDGAKSILPLQRLILGGEAASWSLIEQIRQLSPHCHIINHYGPTETTVGVMTYAISNEQTIYTTETVPLGRPLPNIQAYVLDEQLQLLPIGVPGELYIGGAGLGRGYLNSPELTKEKFITHSFGNSPQRLYRTGDLVRYLPDGNLEFLGRIDNQVKVRGFRIELEEIEVVLSQHHQIQQAVVALQEDKPGDKRLIAYLVTKPNQQLSIDELRQFLQQKLPEYMLPSGFVLLKKLPLTANGKVNRQALPAPERQLESATIVAPRTPVEEVLTGIWAEILGVKLGIYDNFFTLGGHSLLATQVISRLRKVFEIDLPLRQLFETPTVAEIATHIETAMRAGVTPDTSPLVRDPKLPLSFAQQRLWFLDQFNPQSPFYSLPRTVRLTGNLNVDAFHASINEIVRRHEALRTNFISVDGEPVQQIAASMHVPLPIIDLREFPEPIREEKAKQLALTEAQKGFDLSADPLLRVTLLRMAEDEHILLFAMHHIISDGWSIGILINELTTLYQAFSAGKPSPLPELLIQYADFATWQHRWLQTELEPQLNYWQQQLADITPLQLPTDLPRPAVQSFRGATTTISLSPELTSALQALSRRQGVTLFMTLLAAFQTLLYRYSGQSDIAVGSPIANRNRVEIEPLIGFFANTLVLRSNVVGTLSFADLLQQVRQMTLAAYTHQDLPFEYLVAQLQPDRSLDRNPLFQVMFALQSAAVELNLPGLSVSVLECDRTSAIFDLSLSLQETDSGLSGSLEYNTDLFHAETIARMVEHFEILLEEIVANPQQHLKSLPLLSRAEQHQLLVEWNNTHVDYPLNKCIHELFAAQVEKTPDALAVVCGENLSYRELDRQANCLAQYLQTLGVKPELVGLCVERSLDMVVGMMAILKAGGAYVPLDPAYPQERLAYIVEDAKLTVILTQTHLHSKLPPHQAQIICLDSDEINYQADIEYSSDRVNAENLAYVIYTSGSTGKPKGVLVSHRALVNHSLAVAQAYQLQPQDRVLQFASISFDVAAEEIFASWLSGATVVIRTEQISSFANFQQFLSQQKLSVLNLPTAYWHEWVSYLQFTNTSLPSTVRLVIVGTEQASSEKLALWQKIASQNVRWLNAYGPTEATIGVTVYEANTYTEQAHAYVPVGRPIANTQIYILDQHLNPTPVGIPGELYIGGACLAKGYLNQPKLTLEKFIPNPFSREPDACLYKTGDVARYLPDGNIELIGRIDDQVKIRGFRIELGEIRAVLQQHPDVSVAVVQPQADIANGKRLVAYIVPNRDIDTAELRRYLQQKLPDYMVPWAFVLLDSLPLTPNGKLDLQALPAPQIERSSTLPKTAAEEVVADVWKQVLNLEQVGIQDNFFELGGHSLLATQVTSRLSRIFQIEFPIRCLFEAPTIEGLVEALAKLGNGQDIEKIAQTIKAQPQQIETATQIIPRRNTDSCPLSFAQARLWFLNQLGTDSAYNIFEAVCLKGWLDIEILQQSFNEILCRHEVLRTSFALVDGQPVQIIAPTLSLTISVVDLRHLPNSEKAAEVKRLAKSEAQCPFNLAQAPLLRVTLLKLGETEHVVLLTMHHIIADGWSIGILINELTTLYQAFSAGKPSPLTELPIQYADFATWQHHWLQSELEPQLNYWQQQLADITPLQLPTDLPRPAVQSFRGATTTVSLSPALTAALQALSRRQGVTLFMTLLAAFQTLLYRYSGQSDIAVGSPIANRNRVEIEPLIGFFVNTLVLRSYLTSNQSFADLLQQVRQMTLAAYTHQDLPFEYLVAQLQPDRSLDRNPLFQVMFALQNAAVELKLPDLNLSVLECDRTSAIFDLSLSLQETDSGLRGGLQYNTDLFHAETIARMVEHFEILLEGIVANPQQEIKSLPLLSRAEQHRLLVEWNDTKIDYQQNSCIHELFAAQVEQTPNAVAVIFENQQLTYRELNERANQLAHYLQKLGVKPEVLVGVCLERSLEMAIALLGILKAGGAYVPLDPDYPPERLAFMLADSQTPVLLTQQQLLTRFPEHHCLCLDTDWQAIAQESLENPVASVTLDNLAYTIYTSGSTGKPKGAMNTHKGISNRLLWMQAALQLTPSDRVLQKTSFSFDVSVWEFFLPLLTGASLVLAKPGGHRDSVYLAELITQQQITTLHFVPSMLQVFLQSGLECHSLKNVICSGEALDYELQEKFFEHCNAKLYNLYGPTEASIDVTWWICQPDQMRIVPIGSPIANTQIYIVDRYLQPVPIGVPGELHIGGVGLARGYWQRPDLTAEKFIPNPFSTEPGDYLYKTGDLARYLPDGNIEYLGRIDDQVKIRGFRIELGEIAAQLNQHPPVQQAIAIARQGDIVAYVASQTHETLTSKELRHFLQEKLPQYMLPSAFVILPEFPLTPNGKLDRKVLPAPEVRRSDLETYVVPQTDWEKAIAQVWRKVLNLEQISIDDNFFELGGHSLLLAQVHSQLREMITVDFSILDMFRYPTIRLLAEYLNQTTVEIRDISTEKIAAGKAQQRKRLQKIKNINYE